MNKLPVKVTVTEEDIDRGVPGNPCWCAVARAVKRALYGKPGDTLIPDGPVKVALTRIHIGDWRVQTPWKVLRFIEDFDAGKAVSPIEFELDG